MRNNINIVKIERIGSRNRNRFNYVMPGLNVFNDFCDMKISRFHSIWLAGGAIRAVFDDTQIEDYDIFCSNQDTANMFRAYLENLGATLVYSNHSLCATYMLRYRNANLKFQVILKRFPNSIEELFAPFDMNVCKFAFDIMGSLYLVPAGLRDAKTRTIRNYHVSGGNVFECFKRLLHYRDKGYTLTAYPIAALFQYVAEHPIFYVTQQINFFQLNPNGNIMQPPESQNA